VPAPVPACRPDVDADSVSSGASTAAAEDDVEEGGEEGVSFQRMD